MLYKGHLMPPTFKKILQNQKRVFFKMILTFLEFCCSCMAFDKGNPISTTMVEVRRQKVETNERFPQKIFFILPTKISSFTKQTICCRCCCHCFLLLNSEMYFCSCYHQQMCFLDSIIVTS